MSKFFIHPVMVEVNALTHFIIISEQLLFIHLLFIEFSWGAASTFADSTT